MIREKFDSHKQAIHLLSEGQEAIKNVLPVGSNSGVNFANSSAADKLKRLMQEVSVYSSYYLIFEYIFINKWYF